MLTPGAGETRGDRVDSKEFDLHALNNSALGITSDGTTMWVADAGTNRVHAYVLTPGAGQTRGDRLRDKEFTLADITLDVNQIVTDGTTLWFLPNAARSKLRGYSLGADGGDTLGVRTEYRDIELDSANGKTSAMLVEGGYIYAANADAANNNAYAYSLPDINANGLLGDILVDGESVPGFYGDAGVIHHGVAADTVQVTVEGTARASDAMVSYGGTDADGGTEGHQVDLSGGAKSVIITVTRGGSTRNYTLNIRTRVTAFGGWAADSDIDILKKYKLGNPRGIWGNSNGFYVLEDNGGDEDSQIHLLRQDGSTAQADVEAVGRGNGQLDNARGMWSDGTTLWIADSDDGILYAHVLATLADAESIDLASDNADARGVWGDGTTIWVSDGEDKKLYAYKVSDESRDSGKDFDTLDAAENDHPAGIWSDGTTMWVLDTDDLKLYAYNMSDKARNAGLDISLTSDNAMPIDIWSDGTTMWVTDETENDEKVYAYSIDPPPPADTGTTWSLMRGMESTTADGLAATTDAFWVVNVADGKVFAFDRSGTSVTYNSAKDFDLDSANTEPTGAWSDGTTLWVTDKNDENIYAYVLTPGAGETRGDRVESKEFDLHDDNNDPRGMTSDGTTMWVADTHEKPIFAYVLTPGAGQTLGDRLRDKEFALAEFVSESFDIATDGATLWVSDLSRSKLKGYALGADGGDTLGVRTEYRDIEFDPGNGQPTALVVDGGHIYAANSDAANNNTYIYSLPDIDANEVLGDILVDGESVPGFYGDAVTIQHGVAADTAQVTVAATARASDAMVSYGGTDADGGTDGRQVDLNAGANSVTITVTRGGSTRTYTLNINRGVAAFGGWAADSDIDILKKYGLESPWGIWGNSNGFYVVEGVTGSTGPGRIHLLRQDGSPAGGDLVRYRPVDSRSYHTRGMWSDGTTLWVADSDDGELHAHVLATLSEPVAGDIDLASDNADARGVWGDGTTIWVSDGEDKKLYAYKVSDESRDSGKDFDTLDAAENDHPAGIWSDGTTMWVLDTDDLKLYAYNMSDKARNAGLDISLTSDNAMPIDIWSDGTTMWVTDETEDDQKVYAYNFDPPPPADTGTTWSLMRGAESTTADGLAATTDAFWVVNVADGKVFAFDRSGTSVTYNSAKDFDLHSANGAPTGAWSDGTTLWVTDKNDENIYAYVLTPGAGETLGDRVESKEFDLHDNNSDPRGMTSDGTTMWVLDTHENPIFAYVLTPGAGQTLGDRLRDKEFALAEFGLDAFDIATDGATLWVSDSISRSKLKSYSLGADGGDTLGVRTEYRDIELDSGNGMTSALLVDGGHIYAANSDAANNNTYIYSLPDIDANKVLGDILVDGVSVPGFYGDAVTIQHGVAADTAQVTVAATARASDAMVSYGGTDADGGTDGRQVDLNAGANSVTITVTRGGSTRTYTLNINRGVAAFGGWAADSDIDILKKYGLNNPWGIWGNSNGFYVVEGVPDSTESGRIHLLRQDGSPAGGDLDRYGATHDLSSRARGLWSDGTTLWIADSNDGKLYATPLADLGTEAGELDLVTANADARGVWGDGTTIWVSDGEDKKLYAYKVSDESRDSGKDFDTLDAAENDHPAGIWSDGTTMWVLDTDDLKLYAYNMSDKARNAGLDISLTSDNAMPIDIWSNGTTMWVTDETDEKVYAYNFDPPPPAPTNFEAAPGHAQVTLSWDDPGDSSITNYEYRYRVTSQSAWNPDWTDIPGSGATTTSYTVQSLTNGTDYTFEVRAVNTNGQGPGASATATPTSGLTAPTSFRAAPGDAQVTLSWDDPGDSSITNYEYRYRVTSQSAWNPDWRDIPGSGATTTSYTVQSLTNGTDYTFEVRTENASGQGPGASATATPREAPAAPTSFEAAPGDARVTLSWDDPGDSSITNYEYRYRITSQSAWNPDWRDIRAAARPRPRSGCRA